MADSEYREYRLRGDLSSADWEATLSVIGRLGLEAEPFDASAAATTNVASRQLPYDLTEINSADEYLVHEHVEQFWPQYHGTGGKHEILTQSFTALTNPVSRALRYEVMSDERRVARARRLGLQLVLPRTDVGFPPHLLPGYAHDSAYVRSLAPAALHVGSFLDFIDRAADLPTVDRPRFLNRPQLRYLGALAGYLQQQVRE